MTYFMSFSSLAWIFLTISGLLSQQWWLFPPDQLFNPGQTDLRKILPAWLCSSVHNPYVAPIVFRVKFNYLRLAFSSFQNPTPVHFQSDFLQIFFFSSQIPVACFPSMLYQFLSPWLISTLSPVVSTASIVFFIKPSLISLGFSHTPPWTATGCSSVYSISIQLNGKQFGINQWLHLLNLAFFLRTPSLLLYI